MAFTASQIATLFTGSNSNRVESLQKLLGYPSLARDAFGSRFWYLRPGIDEIEAEETRPIAVGFYDELNNTTEEDTKSFFTSHEQLLEIYGHYLNRLLADKPVMYLLLPEETTPSSRVALILPTEGGRLRRRSIQTFACDKEEFFQSRLVRLRSGELPMAQKALLSIPLVEWVFYDGATTSSELANQLAHTARRIEKAIPEVYQLEADGGYLHTMLSSFQLELLPNLKLSSDQEKDYSLADIYAQTIAYGLFTARVFSCVKDERENKSKPTDFNRTDAWKLLPETNPFLKQLFKSVSELQPSELGESLLDAIDEIIEILRAAKMSAILSDFRERMNREDIVIRFYEDFLAAYKQVQREMRGVYYTPEAVVSYLVRSVDILIQEKFDKPLGIADPSVMILDPACGTGTFLLYIFKLIRQRFLECPELLAEGLQDKSWSGYVKERLLTRIFGFELLMAPYAISHLKLGLFLEETGYSFETGQRLGVYLTNTLEDNARKEEVLFKEFIASESDAATEIKRDKTVMVVIGNPPYSYDSSNKGEWISSLVRDYYQVDGMPLGERNPKGLQDDYVKFIRFAQWKLSSVPKGILALITNHGFLDNPTFRGMRQSLMNSFDRLVIYDLHGNSKKKEKQANGKPDGNIFDIQQGVAITFGIKGDEKSVQHCHLWGDRLEKYTTLQENNINTTSWHEIKPQSPTYLLIPQDNELLPEYELGWKITDIMPVNSTGVKTHRDHFVLDFEAEILREKISNFRDLEIADAVIADKFNLENTQDWNLTQKRISLAANPNWQRDFTTCLYRPFDRREYYCNEDVVNRPRNEVMRHMIDGDNLGLVFMRQVAIQDCYNHFLVVSSVIDNRAFYSNKGTTQLAPLYIYADENIHQAMQPIKSPNFSANFLKAISAKLGYLPTPEAIFYYIYAVLYSPTYRTRYGEFLKIDFPRIPITSDNALFSSLANYGEQLVSLHLMKSEKLNTFITQYQNNGGDNLVDSGYPKYINNSVIINKKGDKFLGVPDHVWNFYIGGYQVCQKWLKDRKSRHLTPEDINHYQKVVVALSETINLMREIDNAINQFPIL